MFSLAKMELTEIRNKLPDDVKEKLADGTEKIIDEKFASQEAALLEGVEKVAAGQASTWEYWRTELLLLLLGGLLGGKRLVNRLRRKGASDEAIEHVETRLND